MKKVVTIILVAASVLCLGMPTFAAGTVTPPAIGHPFYESDRDEFEVFDNHVMNKNMGARYWATPLVTPTNVGSIRVYQTASNTSSAVFSFNASGSVSDWTSYTTKGGLGSVDVPSSGSVFVRSKLIGDCIDCHQMSKLSSIRWYKN